MIIDQNFNLYDDGNCAKVPVTHIQVFKSLSLQKEKQENKMFATLLNELTDWSLLENLWQTKRFQVESTFFME